MVDEISSARGVDFSTDVLYADECFVACEQSPDRFRVSLVQLFS